ncbi:alpha/beta fold hydrolase [Luteimonas deserti]|uniref:Alpha/beta hydrolase n=1 Tax=Luteimonas deserti TaxID=2752306 RepID=A0A7Z0QR45_9GAMM|nr:alpha/beta hydrolase [Luteimonas deserti]NYZ63178.1 alpha/beta hydrolase [Luteimonas deserti]
MGAWALAAAMWAGGAAHAVDVPVSRGSYVLQAQQQGQGPVTVVFESGFGQGAGVWKPVIEGLGADCRCIAYSRAGIGPSGADGTEKSIAAHVADLVAVVDTLAPDTKIVVVGHSYGGLLVTEFARRYPERVQGLVLVDPATMGQRHAFRQADAARVQADDTALLAMLPPALGAEYRTLVAQLDAPAAAAPHAMPDVPVALLTTTQVAAEPFVFEETARGKALWKVQHAALFAGFSQGTHRYFATGHNLHREDPEAVVAAIREVVSVAQ